MWLKIEANLANEFRITWGNKDGQYPFSYSVGTQTLRNQASSLRVQLANLARSSDATARWNALTAVATEGANLRKVLFHSPANKAAIIDLKNWIQDEYTAGDHELFIQADSSIHLPWGLIYDGPLPLPAAVPVSKELEIKQLHGFWGLKYQVSATQGGQVRSRTRMSRARTGLGLLSLVNAEVWSQIEYQLAATEFDELSRLLQGKPVGMAHDLATCRRMIEASAEADIVFHFLGHHSDVNLDLGNGEIINYVAFLDLIDSLTDRAAAGSNSCSLIFLNACESAIGDLDMSLRSAAARPEFCGTIATEAIVPRDDAARFCKVFLEQLMERGIGIGQILHDLRHVDSLWPQSLLYGCYANPHYRVASV